jgi:hypothetical protein
LKSLALKKEDDTAASATLPHAPQPTQWLSMRDRVVAQRIRVFLDRQRRAA